MGEWISLDTPPRGKEWVVLFHPGIYLDPEGVAIAITSSNPFFARANAKRKDILIGVACHIHYPSKEGGRKNEQTRLSNIAWAWYIKSVNAKDAYIRSEAPAH